MNCLVLWNTVYIDAVLEHLRALGYPVLDEDIARLSPFIRKHINVHGRHSFHKATSPQGRRQLRDPDAPEDPDESDWTTH